MLAKIRMGGGIAVLVTLVFYLIMQMLAKAQPTAVAQVSSAIHEYAQIGSSWSYVLYFVGSIAWFLGSALHSVVLLVRNGEPAKGFTFVPMMGVLGMVFIALSVTSSQATAAPNGPQADMNIVLFAVFFPFFVQLCDLLMPPWQSVPRWAQSADWG